MMNNWNDGYVKYVVMYLAFHDHYPDSDKFNAQLQAMILLQIENYQQIQTQYDNYLAELKSLLSSSTA